VSDAIGVDRWTFSSHCRCRVVVVIVVVVVVVVVSDAGDDVVADCEEVVITVKRPLDTFGRVTFAGVECCDEFFTEV